MAGTPVAAVALFLLAVIGSPGSCETGERPVAVSPALAVSFQAKWDQLSATLDAGQLSSVVFDEGEATSRARQWLEEHDAPVSELLICFGPGEGSASAKVDLPLFPGDVDVLARGRLNLTGEHPQAEIEEISIGGLPGPLADLAEQFITDLIEDQTDEITLDHDYGLTFAEGEVAISGQP